MKAIAFLPFEHHVVRKESQILSRADFAFLDCEPKHLIYVNGLAWYSEVRQRVHDNRITNRLQMLNYRVLRFFGVETEHTPNECVRQIRAARQRQPG